MPQAFFVAKISYKEMLTSVGKKGNWLSVRSAVAHIYLPPDHMFEDIHLDFSTGTIPHKNAVRITG